MSVGSVHVYVLNPDGHLLDSQHVAQAAKPEALIAMLENDVKRLKVPEGPPVLKPTPPSTLRPEPDTLTLNLVSRYLQRKGDDYVLTGQEADGTGWASLPSEDRIVLSRSQWSGLLPPPGTAVGQSRALDPKLATTLLTHFYPPTENWDLTTNRIDEQALTETVLSTSPNRVRSRLNGHLKMKHPFYHKDDDRFVEADIIGFLETDPTRKNILSLRIVTDQADYRGHDSSQSYGVAVRSIP